MRTLSGALIAKQTAVSVVPYVKFKLTSSQTLVNGTGTATGSPISLVNGANTVTVTVVGTFTIYIPPGVTGTVASGTCVVTGSPVTLTEGVNTITTSGAVGTITVTVAIVTYDYTTRVLNLEHHEEGYNDYATVVLDNHDRGVANNVRGYWVQIAYGYITGNAVADVEGAETAGNDVTAEYSYTPRLWVKNQLELSSPGNLKIILELEGAWGILGEARWFSVAGATPQSFYFKDYEGTASTAYDIISAMLVEKGFTLDALGDQDDGIIDTLTPLFQINGADVVENFDTYAEIIYRLLTTTKCYLRAKTGLAFKVIYPYTTDAVKETYYSDQQYIFREYLERKKLLIPNHIYVMWGDDPPGIGMPNWQYTPATLGEASDTTEIARYKDTVGIIRAGELINPGGEAAADIRASAILARIKAEQLGGHLIVRHDCSVELYDKVLVVDTRGL